MKEAKSTEELREEAVEVLYQCLLSKQEITKKECYEIYDKMQNANAVEKNGNS